jgi:hypothetical protein
MFSATSANCSEISWSVHVWANGSFGSTGGDLVLGAAGFLGAAGLVVYG